MGTPMINATPIDELYFPLRTSMSNFVFITALANRRGYANSPARM